MAKRYLLNKKFEKSKPVRTVSKLYSSHWKIWRSRSAQIKNVFSGEARFSGAKHAFNDGCRQVEPISSLHEGSARCYGESLGLSSYSYGTGRLDLNVQSLSFTGKRFASGNVLQWSSAGVRRKQLVDAAKDNGRVSQAKHAKKLLEFTRFLFRYCWNYSYPGKFRKRLIFVMFVNSWNLWKLIAN